jgi:anti-sigma factor RsiW
MNCEKCQELISDFLDGALSDDDRRSLDAHLEECLSCDSVRHELDSIVTYCRDHRGEYDAPPNERALWLRIRNTIESQRGVRGLAAAGSSGTGEVIGWVSRLFNRQWELSLPQMAAAAVAIAICVSLVTVLGMRSFQSTSNVAGTDESASSRARLANAGSIDERMKLRQQVIDHWSKRVEQRKALWNAQTRGAFERNLLVIDQAVYAFREELQRNPHDQVSAEMLDAAMSDKMDLLSEFSEL